MSVFEGNVETESATERKFVVSRPCRGRYAPSPTGHLHLGNASTALAAWLSVRSRDGCFVMRMEDLDEGRVRSGLAECILEDLEWLGLDWDEGPDRGGPHAPYEQSGRTAHYDRAFDELRAAGRVYPCFCSRKDIAAAASAPQAPGDEARYPGTCRDLGPEEADRLALCILEAHDMASQGECEPRPRGGDKDWWRKPPSHEEVGPAGHERPLESKPAGERRPFKPGRNAFIKNLF